MNSIMPRVNQRVRIYGRADLGVGEVLRVAKSLGLYRADVVFEGLDGQKLETFPLDRLEPVPDLWERLVRGDFDPPRDFLLKQLAFQVPVGAGIFP
ncbi:MAG: hypothetical protein HYY65_05075 [Candidatus Tectomicrobia bacterium]|uniref:Uncharacterized protein n=1 Tax=Tectimicrobiota bacterium TaxID=2528274 RepID=A0A932GP69_UNCTE|nr:hypothetical protein [Candidatus Tectomicrobia bacterium]